MKSGGKTECNDDKFCGVVGLVGAMTIGTWCHFCLLALYSMFMINWELETRLATERLHLERATKGAQRT